MKRIIDANLNRGTEALRVLEEISRFLLDDRESSQTLKLIRHELNALQEHDYDALLSARDTENDIGTTIKNPDFRTDIENIFKANIKRLQQVLRVLAEYAPEHASTFENLRYKSYTLEKIMWDKLKEKYNKLILGNKKLYLVTNSDKFDSDDAFLDAVASALKGGVDILQLREKNMPANRIIELGKKIKLLCAEYNATFIVNDRVDIAAILEADGVHLGQDDMDVASARKILGNNAIIGVSTHAPEQAQKAVQDGADYIGMGPVFTTPTKPGRKSVGLEYVEWVSKNIDIPAFAIGGIDLDNVGEVIQHGAKRIAVVRAIINASSPENAAQQFLDKIENKSGASLINDTAPATTQEEVVVVTPELNKPVVRPWGYYTVIAYGKGFLTKIIHVNPGQKLSVQSHNHRSEHWVVLTGMAKVSLESKEMILSPEHSIDIPVKAIHSLENPYDEDLEIIEVQKGDLLSEDDIIRYADIYGRA